MKFALKKYYILILRKTINRIAYLLSYYVYINL